MKCPFLTIRKEVYDKTGKKIKEELELQDCIKNDCMVYDGATKLCSLLSSNMKSGVMIDDLKNGFKELRNDLQVQHESLSTALSSALQPLQEALLGRFDILKKQNEVMVLGFDRLVETIVNKFEGLRTNLTTFAQTTSEENAEFKALFQSLQHTVDEIRNAHIQFSDNTTTFNEKLLNTIIEQSEGNTRVCEGTNAKLEVLQQVIDKMTATSQANMEAMSGAIDRIVTSHQESVGKLQTLVTGINDIASVVRGEVAGMKTEIVNASGSIGGKIDALSASLAETMKPGIDAVTELMRTEVAGLKTETISVLSGISAKFDHVSAALGETMKPGIDTVTNTMKTEFGTLRQEMIVTLGNLSTKFDGLSAAFAGEIKGNTEHMSIKMTELNQTSNALKADLIALKESLIAKLDQLTMSVTETGKTQEKAMQSIATGFSGVAEVLRTDVTDLKSNTATVLEGFNKDVGKYIEAVRREVVGLKSDQAASLMNVQGTVMQLQELFKNSSDSMGSMSDMMKNLNSNYIESLSKIAGLAEGMRKGVAQVGEGMHGSVKDLVKEMKSEIGALEKQYEKTFGDIAQLAGKFEDLNKRIKEMTKEVEKEFKDSFDRQEQLSTYTKTILEHIKTYFEKEEVRYKEERVQKHKKEGLDHFDRATLYYYRGNYELAVNEINKSLEIEKTAEYLNLKGLLLAELGKFDDSKKVFAEALKIEPNLAEINNNLGLLYLRMKKLDDAVVAFQEAVKKNVNYALAYVNLGKAYIEAEKYDDAVKAYEKALQIDPSNYDAQEAIKLYKEGKIGA